MRNREETLGDEEAVEEGGERLSVLQDDDTCQPGRGLVALERAGGRRVTELLAAWEALAPRLPEGGKAARLLIQALKLAMAAMQKGVMAREGGGRSPTAKALAVAATLADLRMDAETIAAGLVRDAVERGALSHGAVEAALGEGVTRVLHDSQRVRRAPQRAEGLDDSSARALRQFCLAFHDPRAIIIELAVSLHTMRHLEDLPKWRQQMVSLETMQVWAPLAHALGTGPLMWELEDSAFQVLFPQSYQSMADWLQGHWPDGESAVEACAQKLETAVLEDEKIMELLEGVSVRGRCKSLYSTMKKLLKDGRSRHEVHDILGLRVIVTPKRKGLLDEDEARAVEACYLVREVAARLWEEVPERFKDYIAHPKKNNYQSLHLAVHVSKAKNAPTLELQIRTAEMDVLAVHGAAAHNAYKSGLTDPEQVKQLKTIMEAIKMTEMASTRFEKLGEISVDGGQGEEESTDTDHMFAMFDINGDGSISMEEVHTVMSEVAMETPYAPEDARELMALLDSNKDGSISASEFAEFRRQVRILQDLPGVDHQYWTELDDCLQHGTKSRNKKKIPLTQISTGSGQERSFEAKVDSGSMGDSSRNREDFSANKANFELRETEPTELMEVDNSIINGHMPTYFSQQEETVETYDESSSVNLTRSPDNLTTSVKINNGQVKYVDTNISLAAYAANESLANLENSVTVTSVDWESDLNILANDIEGGGRGNASLTSSYDNSRKYNSSSTSGSSSQSDNNGNTKTVKADSTSGVRLSLLRSPRPSQMLQPTLVQELELAREALSVPSYMLKKKEDKSKPEIEKLLKKAREMMTHRGKGLSQARELLQQLVKEHPINANLWVHYAQLERKTGNIVDARSRYEQSIRVFEYWQEGGAQFMRALQAWATLEVQDGKWDEASRLFKKALNIGQMVEGEERSMVLEAEVVGLHAWAVLEKRRGRWARCRELLMRAEGFQPGNAIVLHTRALLEKDAHNWGLARRYFRRAAKAGPLDAVCWQAWGVMEAELGNVKRMRELFHRGLEVDPKSIHTLQAWAHHEARINTSKSLQKARELFQRCLSFAPQAVYVWQSWAVMEQKAGNLDESRRLFEKGLEISPSDVACLQAYARLERQCGNRELAKNALTLALVTEPTNPAVLQQVGEIEEELGNLISAKELFVKAGVIDRNRSRKRRDMFQIRKGTERYNKVQKGESRRSSATGLKELEPIEKKLENLKL